MRSFWYDELFTFHLTQEPSFADFWKALLGGADFNPPLGYIIARAFQAVLGNSELSTRLPQVLGFFLMSLCLYRFVARGASPRFGYVAALLPWCSGAYGLASEARPYGLMLGFGGLALICWQEAAERSERRNWFLSAFAMSLAAAALTHCYAVLMFIPFGIAEIVRQFHRGKFDAKMWAALLAPTASIILYLPLLANSKSGVFDSYFFKVPLSMVPQVYGYLLSPALWPLAISALLMTIPFLKTQTRAGSDTVRLHEWVVAAGFATLPGIAVLLAKTMSSPFFPRYGSSGVLGLSLLFALYMRWRDTPLKVTGWVVTAFLGCYAVMFGQWLYPIAVDPPIAEKASLNSKERRQSPFNTRTSLPFVAANGLRFYEIDHYGSAELTSRLYFLLDRDAALEYTQSDIFDNGFPLIARWFPMRGKLAQYKTFVRENPKFLVFGSYMFPNDWLLKKLIDDGATVALLSDRPSDIGDSMLFEVTLKQPTPASGN